MSSGLFALLDDVTVIAKTAAASLDDVAAATVKAGSKSAGVVIDDAAVTPKYVLGFAAERELPIVRKIAVGSLRNKLLILLPAALALSLLAPWLITPLLMLGGLYLAFEGTEKVVEFLTRKESAEKEAHARDEATTVKGAIRTDFILSAEIMALTLSTVADQSFTTQAVVLGLVGVLITFVVYGAVAIIVKADDVGAALALRQGAVAALGRGIVLVMPYLLTLLSVVGTLAMLWVSGGILAHGLAGYGLDAPEHWIEEVAHAVEAAAPFLPATLGWITQAALLGLGALVVGLVLLPLGKLLHGSEAAAH